MDEDDDLFDEDDFGDMTAIPPESVRSLKNAFLTAALQVEASAFATVPMADESSSSSSFTPEVEYEIRRRIASGWTIESILAFLQFKYKLEATRASIIEIAKTQPGQYQLPSTFLATKFQNVPIVVDTVSEMYRVLRVMAERVGAAVIADEAVGRPTEAGTDIMETYFKMIKEAIQVEQSLGERKDATSKGNILGVGFTETEIASSDPNVVSRERKLKAVIASKRSDDDSL